jgi:tetracycline 7-halogenase / FADH2 O2-dependent halogenase
MYDIAIVGSGFAGSLLAMIARRLGHSVMLIERGKHPRVVIGESSTPLTNLLFEELTTRYDLPVLRPLAKWGSWQRTHPQIGCGLKRGFTFYHHSLDNPRTSSPTRNDQLLVAASPRDEISDTHWYRADFDYLFVREAQRMGVEYLDETNLTGLRESDHDVRLAGTRLNDEISISAKFIVDASGPRGFLHRALGLEEIELPQFPATQALYSHFSNVGRLADSQFGQSEEQTPYPVDDAAVHHVFDGGWIWVLQFNNGITSAGIAAVDSLAERLKLTAGEDSWNRIVQSIPALAHQFAAAKTERPFTRIPRLSFRSDKVAGKRWALLPSAAGFIDPLLSTGFPLTLLGVDRLAKIIENDWNTSNFEMQLMAYASKTDAELVATGHLIGSLYATMSDFPVFVSLSLMYFAAASFAETARRLGKHSLAPGFLLHDDPVFGPALARFCKRARRIRTRQESAELSMDILRAIEPFNVAGLGRPQRRNWYPVDPQDLVDSAAKFKASPEDMVRLLERCGFHR